uniref:Serine/threonine-protein kinase 11-interacting protein n=2 Tax=Zeugodacus cucurbitae TaxID=28588 RepID=A0A0A1X2V1_ZEUCU
MDPQKITELANLLRKNGDKILSSEFSLTLSGSLLRALNDSFTLITDGAAEIGTSPQTFQVAKTVNSRSPVFTDLQLIYDFVQKTPLLCIVHYATDEYFDGTIDISKFRALRRLEVQKTSVRQVVGIQRLRAQLQQLICVKSLTSVEDIITRCGGDNSNGFVWNELKIADFSYNNLQRVDAALEFAQFLQHLNLRHNKLRSVEAVKWLPHLKTLDLSYNCLQCVPQFHLEAYKRLQSLNMSNNFVEDLMGIAKLEALTDLDLSDNCLLDHSCLLPLSALITLNYLNLYGNALCCHPKHRLATAQFLHKNTATVKFLLDLEPLSKSEKSVTGSQQLRHVGALNRYAQRSSSTSINSSRVPSSTHTPSSSVGSLSSFKFNVSSTNSVKAANGMRKSSSKTRTVDIIEDEGALPQTTDERDEAMLAEKLKPVKIALEKGDISEQDTQHLEAKKQIENLREKYGVNWLQSGNAEMIQSALEYSSFTGMETKSNTAATNTSRQQLDDFLGELSESALASSRPTSQTQYDNNATYDSTLRSSTPLYESRLSGEVSKLELHASPIKANGANDNNDATMYQSMNSTNSYTNENQTFYRTVNDSDNTLMQTAADSLSSALEQANMSDDAETEVEIDDEPPHLKNVYANATIEESDVSEPEDDEVTYIVYTMPRNEAVFLTISENYLRVRDTLTQKTITKWSLKILESCDRIKSNTIRINFDTIKADKKERIYTVEDGLCQELERKLRDILSQRDLTEMNQTVYRCVNCTCQFAVETKYKPQNQAIHCPDCKSSFVAEIHDIPKPTIEPATEKLSPAAIVEETPLYTNTPPKATTGVTASIDVAIDTNSIVKGSTRLTAINPTKHRNPLQGLKSSANSLNESSSCSKITNSQNSFDSNQSVVGSTNTERQQEFTGESSDVDIISNPSQSSIEVLDQHTSRKASEERRLTQQMSPLAENYDLSYTQSFIEREFGNAARAAMLENQLDHGKITTATTAKATPVTTSSNTATPQTFASTLANTAQVQLIESSSSGSVTDSVCTAYEQQQQQELLQKTSSSDELLSKSAEQAILRNLLAAESFASHSPEPIITQTKPANGSTNAQSSTQAIKKEESSKVSSMFGALVQTTNNLMSSSRKSNSQVDQKCEPYKFNYTDFNDIDHRLKLYFYQTKFDENEQFKWVARGRLYNDNTKTLCAGIVVMSTCKCYLMEAFASENEDVAKWLRLLVSVTADRLESIQLLPWKLGLAFTLRDWGNFELLLQDILRTDSLLLYFANNSLPSQCELKYQPTNELVKRINNAVTDEQLKMCALLNACTVTCGQAKRNLSTCTLLTTDTHLCVSSSKFDWISTTEADAELEICMKQLMSNLVEVELIDANSFLINYLDETQDQSETWQCTFETKENANSCLNAIAQSWEKLFGVSLLNT